MSSFRFLVNQFPGGHPIRWKILDNIVNQEPEHGIGPIAKVSEDEYFTKNVLIDCKPGFVEMVNDGYTSSDVCHPQDFLRCVCIFPPSIKCASALINGETRLTVDVRSPCWKNKFALHYAAENGSPDVTELLLVNNAQTGIRYNDRECFTLPLHMAFKPHNFSDILKQWTPENSINQLLISLCLPWMQDTLENIGLLAWTTKHTEEEFLRYVKAGEVVEVAALLMVAWKKLRDSAIIARSMLTQSEVMVSRDMKTSMLQLFKIFESAGNDLEAYVKWPKYFVPERTVITEVKCLLQRNGIQVNDEETDISYLYRICAGTRYQKVARRPPDFFMEHYGKSGYRWRGNSALWKITRKIVRSLSPATKKYTNPILDPTPATTSTSASGGTTDLEAQNEVKGWRFNLLNVASIKARPAFASVMKFLK